MPLDDMKLTIAIMHNSDGTGTHALRDLYPELIDVWNELDDLRESDADSVTRKEYDDLENMLDDMEGDRDDALNQVAVLESDIEYLEHRQAVQNNALRAVKRILRGIVTQKDASPILPRLEQAIDLLPREE